MTVYVIAQLEFIDEARYRTYQAAATRLFMDKGIRVLAADEAPVVLEGDWTGDKVVVMAFDDEAAARAFLEGPEYQVISEDRRAGARSTAIMIKGF
jgi:uncharacterized protein (DUF1330 family)